MKMMNNKYFIDIKCGQLFTYSHFLLLLMMMLMNKKECRIIHLLLLLVVDDYDDEQEEGVLNYSLTFTSSLRKRCLSK